MPYLKNDDGKMYSFLKLIRQRFIGNIKVSMLKLVYNYPVYEA
jgi:hypothetical protein